MRALLEPLVRDGGTLDDPINQERALRYLADATLFDESLPSETRDELATGYVERLFEADEQYRLPADLHGPKLKATVDDVRTARAAQNSADCEAEALACRADLSEVRADYATLQKDRDALAKAVGEEIVVINDNVARNRAVALVPFGVGHFYNGRTALGATFLATEAAIGTVGLALLIDRTFRLNCTRTAGFARGSLQCSPPPGVTRDEVLLERNVEQTFGILFVSTIVIDIVISQALFEPYQTIGTRETTRGELDQRGQGSGESASPPPAQKKKRRRGAKVRPNASASRRGATFGVSLRF